MHYPDLEYPVQTVRYLRGPIDDKWLLFAHGEGTCGIPAGRSIVEYSSCFLKHPVQAHAEAHKMVERMLERNGKLWGLA